MFSSSGRDTSSWVHTGGHGKGWRLAPKMLSATGGGTGNSGWMSTSYVPSMAYREDI